MILDNHGPVIADSRTIANLKGLAELLGCPVVYRATARDLAGCEAVLAWGRKPSARRAASLAARLHLPLIHLEDGFLRSVDIGNREPPLSVVMDDLGIYYDATAPSRLESCIALPRTEARQTRARALIAAWRAARISKFNHAREYAGLPGRYVLAVDQTLGDASIRYGLADASSFQRMLAAALAENPDCVVVLKVHPEVMAGRKRGYFDRAGLTNDARVQVLAEDVHPASLIEHAEAVYTVTSQMGFEGLIWGKRVRTFGMPFYAGWGLTQDELPAPGRRKPVQLANLVHAALVDYPRYIDPETDRQCAAERVIEWLGLQRKMRERFPAIVHAQGFSLYKKPIVRRFFQGSHIQFVRQPGQVANGSMLVVWGRKNIINASDEAQDSRDISSSPSSSPSSLRAKKINVVRLEDGFIRSVGLGADLVRPLSWVMDHRGIYYDATQPSELETILQTTIFDEALIARARALRERLVAEGLTKYNVGNAPWQCPRSDSGENSAQQKLILVPGQVETDASLTYGAPDIRRNIDLLRAVREAHPDAYLVYKPHPDVVVGLRGKGRDENEASRWCDEIVTDASMGEMLVQIDEVHTLTSLAGFEALLRGKKVVCYGQPFYAGWGLTEDMCPVARRTRRLSPDELVAGALILYPTYVSRSTGRFTTPERTLDELLAWRKASASNLPWWYHGYRFLARKFLRRA